MEFTQFSCNNFPLVYSYHRYISQILRDQSRNLKGLIIRLLNLSINRFVKNSVSPLQHIRLCGAIKLFILLVTLILVTYSCHCYREQSAGDNDISQKYRTYVLGTKKGTIIESKCHEGVTAPGPRTKWRADNYCNEIKRVFLNTKEVRAAFSELEQVSYTYVRRPETEATTRDGYGPVTEFLACWEPSDCR